MVDSWKLTSSTRKGGEREISNEEELSNWLTGIGKSRGVELFLEEKVSLEVLAEADAVALLL